MYLFSYLFGVLTSLSTHCISRRVVGRAEETSAYSWCVKVLHCKLPTNGKQLPAFPLEIGPGTEPRPQRWEARVLPLCHRGPIQCVESDFKTQINKITFNFPARFRTYRPNCICTGLTGHCLGPIIFLKTLVFGLSHFWTDMLISKHAYMSCSILKRSSKASDWHCHKMNTNLPTTPPLPVLGGGADHLFSPELKSLMGPGQANRFIGLNREFPISLRVPLDWFGISCYPRHFNFQNHAFLT